MQDLCYKPCMMREVDSKNTVSQNWHITLIAMRLAIIELIGM